MQKSERKKLKESERGGLESRMTLWVIGTVTAVSLAVVAVASFLYRSSYEEELRNNLMNDVSSTTNAIDVRLSQLEDFTYTSSVLLSSYFLNNDQPGTHLTDALCSIEDVDGVSVILAQDYMLHDSINSNYVLSYRSPVSGEIVSNTYNLPDIYGDKSWIESIGGNREYWCLPYPLEIINKNTYGVSFSVPMYGPDGQPFGMFSTTAVLEWISDMAYESKSRTDIDVAIYAANGRCIVEPAEDISSLDESELIVEKRTIDRLGWQLVFSARRQVINDKVNVMLIGIMIMFLLLILFTAIAIRLSVKHVARPYVAEQKKLAEESAAVRKEIELAAKAQNDLVPHVFPPFPDRREVSISACLHPAQNVGGDLYDYFIDGDSLFFCIGDVSGKGIPASLFMTATHYLLRSCASASVSLSDTLAQMNRTLCTDNSQCNFVTLFLGRLNLNDGVLEYSNAGHNAPLLNGSYLPADNGCPLGLFDDSEYEVASLTLERGDTLLLYTDGVTEAMDSSGQEWGEEALATCVSQIGNSELSAYLNTILDEMAKHVSGAPQSDDTTMLVIRYGVIGVARTF